MISKDELYDLYHIQHLSSYEIAKKFNVSGMTVRCWMRKHEIVCRDKYDFPHEKLLNKEFYGWIITEYLGRDNNNHHKYKCICKCGFIRETYHSRITLGKIRCLDCKPLKRERFKGGYKNITGDVWSKICSCAKKANHSMEISIEYANDLLERQNFHCALSGIPIHLSQNRRERAAGKHTASLDRIDSSKNYIEGNVQWVHKDINLMKRILSDEKFIFYCGQVSDYQRGKNARLAD